MSRLEDINRRLLVLQDKLGTERDPDQRKAFLEERKSLLTEIRSFLDAERSRGKTYGTWNAKDLIRRPPP